MLQEAGFLVEAVAFKRKYHNGRMPNCPVKIIGTIQHGQYFKRFLKMVAAIPLIRRAIKGSDLVYASGADMALISLIAGCGLGKPVVIEIGDIREAQVESGIKGRIVRWLDKRLISSCKLLIATTSAFIENYYRTWLKSEIPAIVIENKIEASLYEMDAYKKKSNQTIPFRDRPLRVGYFGLIRDEWSLNVLKGLASRNLEKFEIIIAGHVMISSQIMDDAKKHSNIFYKGEYKSPHDLPALYNDVDLIWACYPPIKANDMNLKWARPNRFYESCFFKTPLVTRVGTQDATDVDRYQIGKLIKEEDEELVVNNLEEITAENLQEWRQNMEVLPKSVYLYTTELSDLESRLRDIVTNC
jgi:succinoglycan biosynthesis protein ExoL